MFSLLSRRNASTSAYDAVLKRAGIKIPIKPKKEELGPAIIRKSRSVLPTEPPPSSTVPRDNLRFDAGKITVANSGKNGGRRTLKLSLELRNE
jgi:hypothetical protein